MDYYEDDYCQFLDETYPQYETEQISTEGGYADYEWASPVVWIKLTTKGGIWRLRLVSTTWSIGYSGTVTPI